VTDQPVARQLRALLWTIAGCLALLILAYAAQLYVSQRDRRLLNDFHDRGTVLALSMHDAYAAARAGPGAVLSHTPAAAGAFAAAATVAFGRTLAYGDQLLALYTRHPGPPFDAGRRRLERALDQLRALRAEFERDDLGLARAFTTRPFYVGIVGLQLERMHMLAARQLSDAIERRTRWSSIIFSVSAALLLAVLALQARRHLRAIDATLRREAETVDALRRSEARLEEAQRVAQLGSWQLDPAAGRMALSAEMARLLGALDAAAGTDREAFLAAVHPDDRAAVADAMSGTAGDGQTVELIYRLHPPGGDERVVLLRSGEIGQGSARSLFGTVQDITERRAMESQLLQAQKMESVGRLAGGVAHDFNNLLTVITANLSIALDDATPDDPGYELLREAFDAAQSAAQVTRQLLTFSRRQIIDPKVLDVNEVIERVRRLLQRLIGEDVQLRVEAQPRLGRVRIDPAQFEQILINLAVNARDAMPQGGKLTIETADVTLGEEDGRSHPHVRPGEFVMVAVSDDGKGLTAEDKAHLFEPFYTTKSVGHGTGLGLPMVYGAVKQHGGSIEVYSEAEAGTTFRIYLPRVDAELEVQPVSASRRTAGGTETLVLVEDQEVVRNVATRMLRRWGYTVHAFETAEAAIAGVAALDERVHLLVTDVVLPDMNGRVLAERIQAPRPDIAVLFTSGYTGNVLARHGVLDPGLEFLAKPYSGEALAVKVREVLDRRASR
jgi:signal transduction histidine kinase/ActR/RegA family two-component response regulator